ncbi:hypothetical protein N7499_006179 [Penicillium canescens]|uniref:Amino acid transporter transmembrane domain-containing protein n=1 Tax=Penicillium canescens TaxID=5083 RepID=A0AAD6ID56_PENCN|nr:uncharacterized protein N7446_001957 [Penicillium canescens]KAJ6043760.1 hypothetical protein N7460_005115 [Penicillium canescens]KAJ6055232.1 hypothetical protein N7444_004330 [Penicillium canescens]KAJ6074180.1 hypothetical protein N7446_001957 [Penicillium canescens]KAJ6081305.1 hypothetical protein N7499_006179 [Penicillium canescens]
MGTQPSDIPNGKITDNSTDHGGDIMGEMSDRERNLYDEGMKKFSRLGWKRLTVVLIVEAIALGTLSIPSSFATLGMVAGIICTVGIGLVAIYTSYVIGQVKLAYPEITNYADAGRLMGGRVGYEIVSVMLGLQLTFLTASHCLTGTIALQVVTQSTICAVVFGVVCAVILLALAVPPSFTEMAILGYIDFGSIIIAIGITIIAAGIENNNTATTAVQSAAWSAWPPKGTSFTDAFIAVSNIIFAYSFAICQFSFMDEMHTPKDYVKSIWALGITEIVIYTVSSALIYSFIGAEVKGPAMLSINETVSRIAFGVALPVIFISGSINTVVAGRAAGWATWLGIITVITIIAFVIAEVIPFFEDLLSLISALFISGFTFYIPALMWLILIRKGSWTSPRNLALGALNLAVLVIGLVILAGGTYASIQDILDNYKKGTVGSAFSCGKQY